VDGREVDHGATAGLAHLGYGIVRGAIHGFEADVHAAVPGILGDFDGAAWPGAGVRVVHDDVQLAPQLDGAFDRRAHAGLRGDVRRERLGHAASGADRLDVAGCGVFLDVDDEHTRAFLGESARRGAANTHRTAGNNGDLVR